MRRFLFLALLSAMTASAHGQDTTDAEMKRRLVLAQQYENLTHREKRVETTFAGQLRLIWNGCTDDACRLALDQAIAKAISESGPQHERAVVKLLASHATEDELRAAIAFAQSPPGQAIIAAEVDMDEELANIAHTFSKDAGASVRKSFCASQSEACARVFARLAEKPAGRP